MVLCLPGPACWQVQRTETLIVLVAAQLYPKHSWVLSNMSPSSVCVANDDAQEQTLWAGRPTGQVPGVVVNEMESDLLNEGIVTTSLMCYVHVHHQLNAVDLVEN